MNFIVHGIEYRCIYKHVIFSSHGFVLNIQACLLPAPKGKSCANYARCVNQILENLHNMKVLLLSFHFQFDKIILKLDVLTSQFSLLKLWLRIPLSTKDDDSIDANSDRSVSEHTPVVIS